MEINELYIKKTLVSELCENIDLNIQGSDIFISKLGSLDTLTDRPEEQLTYAFNERYIDKFIKSDIRCCIIPNRLNKYIQSNDVSNKTFLLTKSDPETLFFEILIKLGHGNKWQKIESSFGVDNSIASSAIIYSNVVIGDRCTIMDNVVIMPNTIIGNDVIIKPNTVIGGDGFLVKEIKGNKLVVPHFGGVKIYDNVEIGSNSCVDKGMFGEFTLIGTNTKLDNHVHIGHSAQIGSDCIITAGSIVGGSTILKSNVYLGINSTINQLLEIDSFCFVGSGTVVNKSLTPHSLVVGSPARNIGYVCSCRAKIDITQKPIVCSKCESEYELINSIVVKIDNKKCKKVEINRGVEF
ncbi:UDP-3-O-[3-hydroxymyristoyl] glucosamine N-acyltransferase [Bacillus ectoiniformans]|uniref:UDP-3-O-(3-hydroxymyristoyl)glucosamine N-acyltransferase n=1 Tax=Bacillus ectoiniformans TaxID=1494429 RepID=UPI001957F7A4|nr:UDP-3-O-(3-hydroxymyristoyl)glucosamine N-acyltransferase [Bacillus ectoiniformans]MBM7649369.1 UDP-3-O-[3-hydroxymyristoyl] glucosamine N-acyltransferase [Bacillus ectoiniformans]